MKLMLKIIACFFIQNLSAEDFEFEGEIHQNKPYLFISLGCNCWQAQALRLKAHSLRESAFPFDWLLSPDNDKLILCLDERFKHFTDEACLIRYEKFNLENVHYNLKFTHEWIHQGLFINEERHKEQLEYIQKKYARRIARFNNLRNYKGKVFFVRSFQTNTDYKGEWGWNAQNAQNLRDALKRYFPDLNFTLVIVSCTDPAISEIGELEGIKEFKIKDLIANDFAEYATMYAELLQEFKLA